MARILITADHNPAIVVELRRLDTDPDRPWTGSCTGCAWTVENDARYTTSTADAVEYAGGHVDSHPDTGPIVRRLNDLYVELCALGRIPTARRVAGLADDVDAGLVTPADTPGALRGLRGLRGGVVGDLADRAIDDIAKMGTR